MSESVFAYCERGTDPSAFAEPVNAASNVSFLLAALFGVWFLAQRSKPERSIDHWLLIGLVAAIGAGSAAFHIFGTRATALLDTAPIALFTLVYLGFALNRLLNLPPGLTSLTVLLFAGVMFAASEMRCTSTGLTIGAGPGAHVCLNGSIAYIPAFAAVLVVGLAVYRRGHQAGPYLLWAAAVFATSLVFRTLDKALCDSIVFAGRPLGTHFAWHLLNGVVILLLLRASFTTGPRYGTLRRPSPPRPTVEAQATELVLPDERTAIATPMPSPHKSGARRADVVELVDTQDLKS